MNIITTLFNYFIFFFIGIVATCIFVQTNKELWDEVGKEATHDLIVKMRELTVKSLDGIVSLLNKARLTLWKIRNRLSREI